LVRTPDGLAWQLRGQAVKTLTEDGVLQSRGQIKHTNHSHPLAKRWADAMTEKYDELSAAIPLFGQLRNCMDLAVIAALISKEDLLNVAACDLKIMLDGSRLRGPQFHVPKSIGSRATVVRGRRGWLVSVSGGVDLDSWSVLSSVQTSQPLKSIHDRASKKTSGNWWWD
jgi:hypothetical protein